MLGEFVDDASQGRGEPKRVVGDSNTDCVKKLVQQVAGQMAVPQFHFAEVVEKALAILGPEIEDRVRKEVQGVLERRERNSN